MKFRPTMKLLFIFTTLTLTTTIGQELFEGFRKMEFRPALKLSQEEFERLTRKR